MTRPGEHFKAKACMEEDSQGQLLLDKASGRIHQLLISTVQLAPTEGTVINVKASTLQQLQQWFGCKQKSIVGVVESGPNHISTL